MLSFEGIRNSDSTQCSADLIHQEVPVNHAFFFKYQNFICSEKENVLPFSYGIHDTM